MGVKFKLGYGITFENNINSLVRDSSYIIFYSLLYSLKGKVSINNIECLLKNTFNDFNIKVCDDIVLFTLRDLSSLQSINLYDFIQYVYD